MRRAGLRPQPGRRHLLGLLLVLGFCGLDAFHGAARRDAVRLEKAMNNGAFVILHGEADGKPIHVLVDRIEVVFAGANEATHVVTSSAEFVVRETPAEVIRAVETRRAAPRRLPSWLEPGNFVVEQIDAIVNEPDPLKAWRLIEELSAETDIPINVLNEQIQFRRDNSTPAETESLRRVGERKGGAMSFVTLHGRDGRLVHIRPEQVSVVDTDEDGETTVTVDSTYCWVRESPEEVLALVESWESNDVAAAMKTVGKQPR